MGIIRFTEQFFWTLIWIFLILIVGFWLLGWMKTNWSNNPAGSFASWVSSHAEPQA